MNTYKIVYMINDEIEETRIKAADYYKDNNGEVSYIFREKDGEVYKPVLEINASIVVHITSED